MTALRASDVARRLGDAARLPPIVLVFGPDRGLVTEVSDALTALFPAADDPFAVVKLDAATVAADPGRLMDEAGTVSLFGERRLILVRDGGTRNLAPALAPLLAQPPTDCVVVVEAGDLRRGMGLRKAVEDHGSAVAVYCPTDSERDLDRMIDEEAARLALRVDAEARALLRDRLGADRAASRNEVLKACLHAAETGVLGVADVNAVVGDVGVSELADAVDAALLGQRRQLDQLLSRLLRHDSAAVQLLMTAQRTLHALELAAAAVANGTAPTRAVEAVRPPFYGARKEAAARILDRWPAPRLRHASEAVASATFTTRLMPGLAAAVARDVLLRIVSQPAAR